MAKRIHLSKAVTSQEFAEMLTGLHENVTAMLCRLVTGKGEFVDEAPVLIKRLEHTPLRIGGDLLTAVELHTEKNELHFFVDYVHDPDDQAIPQGNPEYRGEEDWWDLLQPLRMIEILEWAEQAPVKA